MEDIPEQYHLLPAAVDYRAKHDPERVFALLPKGDTLQDGWYPLTYRMFAKAIDETCWWLDEVLRSVLGVEMALPTVPYIGSDDWRYTLLMYAAVKTGRKVSWLST